MSRPPSGKRDRVVVSLKEDRLGSGHPPPMNMKRLLKEPMFHFLLLAGALFVLSAWRGGDDAEDTKAAQIEVGAAAIDRLKAGYERQFGTAPDADELRGLVDDHIREEVLCREALAMGLDRDDTIVRRRMAQKMEFLTNDIATGADPDDGELEQYFTTNAKRYAKPERIGFRHVYFSNEKRGAGATAATHEALAALRQGSPDDTLGDAFLHGFEFENRETTEISALFGPRFTADLADQPQGEWRGPLASSYGFHLVLVETRTAAAPVSLNEARAEVLRDFNENRRQETNRRVYEGLRSRYDISVDEAALLQASPSTNRTAQQ